MFIKKTLFIYRDILPIEIMFKFNESDVLWSPIGCYYSD